MLHHLKQLLTGNREAIKLEEVALKKCHGDNKYWILVKGSELDGLPASEDCQ